MMWGMSEPCGAAGCSNSTCNECSPGEWTTCNGAATQLLSCLGNGTYPASGMACSNGCFEPTANAAYCGDCTPTTDTTCAGAFVRTCASTGKYPTSGGMNCGSNQCWEPVAGDAYCGTCTQGSPATCMGKQRMTCSPTTGNPVASGAVCPGNCFNGVCVDCAEGIGCSGGQVCNEATNLCVTCLNDVHCAAPNPRCVSMACVACTAMTQAADCLEDEVCVDNQCQAAE
jgi:hypothetical protein